MALIGRALPAGPWRSGSSVILIMASKLDHERQAKRVRIAAHGSIPIAADYAEFPPKPRGKQPPRPRDESTLAFIDGKPNLRNPKVRWRYLSEIEIAYRRGEQGPRLPRRVLAALAAEIEAIRTNPEVVRAYHAAVAQRHRGRG
ncbi:MAG: hypothetical protein ACREDL_01180 [Bradyrhizobium sp.]